jgi:hypothetical protein
MNKETNKPVNDERRSTDWGEWLKDQRHRFEDMCSSGNWSAIIDMYRTMKDVAPGYIAEQFSEMCQKHLPEQVRGMELDADPVRRFLNNQTKHVDFKSAASVKQAFLTREKALIEASRLLQHALELAYSEQIDCMRCSNLEPLSECDFVSPLERGAAIIKALANGGDHG